MNRDELISLAYHYQGEYDELQSAILRKEKIAPIACPEKCIVMGDADYPSVFYQLKHPPYVLFYRGKLSLLKTSMVAVVGSRKACAYALEMTRRLCYKKLSEQTVISGLAKGIDGEAHRHAKYSIGILGCGIHYCYPSCHRALIEKMAEKQLILSEYPAYSLPLAHHFPFRNRLIAALANEVYIMQATIPSGTLTTVKEALDLGKDIYVLPYSLSQKEGMGNLTLLQEGANYISLEDVFDEDELHKY